MSVGCSPDLPQHFADQMGYLVGPDFPSDVMLAVSGGGDSMAMLYLAAPWARVMGIRLHVATVDHNLRAEAAAEAGMVRAACQELGVPHQTLSWVWDGHGNLQAAARDGRLGALARARGAANHILMAHTQDDQAETLMMRLARGTGAEGLSGMAETRRVPGQDPALHVVRPLLQISRAALRHYLNVLKIPFADDPSNDDPRYDRVRVRQAWPALERLGVTRKRLASTAEKMAQAREALAIHALNCHDMSLSTRSDPAPLVFDVAYDRDHFARIDRHTQLRLLSAALRFVGRPDYGPRFETLEAALDRALGGGATTLHGGYVFPSKNRLFVCPEYAALRDMRPKEGLWNQWLPSGDHDLRPLGPEGAAQIRDRTDLPARVLWPTPALWQADRVVAALRLGDTTVVQVPDRRADFRNIVKSH